MKYFALLVSAALLTGCADTAVTSPETGAATQEPAAPEVGSAPMVVTYEAGESVTLAIPEMHCPFGCFPRAQEALEGIDGIAGVELVEQEEEGVINDRRVVVNFDGSVVSHSAIAALDAVDLQGASFE